MENVSQNILTDDLLSTLSNTVNTKKMVFQKGEFLPTQQNNKPEIGILLKGSISLMRADINGNWSLIEKFMPNQLISFLWVYNLENDIFFVCNEASEIIFFDYLFLIQSNNPSYNKFILYLFQNIITYTNSLSKKITILQKRNTQDKLLAYFKLLSQERNSNRFEIPVTYKELAEFLGIDRSAMMRKLGEMEQNKIIVKKGKTIYLKKNS